MFLRLQYYPSAGTGAFSRRAYHELTSLRVVAAPNRATLLLSALPAHERLGSEHSCPAPARLDLRSHRQNLRTQVHLSLRRIRYTHGCVYMKPHRQRVPAFLLYNFPGSMVWSPICLVPAQLGGRLPILYLRGAECRDCLASRPTISCEPCTGLGGTLRARVAAISYLGIPPSQAGWWFRAMLVLH